MNDSDLRQLADALTQVLRPHLEQSEALRKTVALIGKWLWEEADRLGAGAQTRNELLAQAESTIAGSSETAGFALAGTATPIAVPHKSAGAPAAASPAAASPAMPVSSALLAVTLGETVIHVPTAGTAEELGRARQSAIAPRVHLEGSAAGHAVRYEADLELVERRCRLKAASCRLFIEKRSVGADPDAEYEVRQRLNEMIGQAKSMPNCFLWVFWRERTPPDDATLSRIAETYDAHASAVALMRKLDESGAGARSDEEADAFHLLAEANSALRVALAETWLTDNDRDQSDVHVWLRQETASRRVFIERHMTADDPADPCNAADLCERIHQVSKRIDDRVNRARGIKSAFGQIKYHAGQIVKNGSDGASADWSRIADAVTRLASMGIVASDRRIAEAVGPDAAALWPAEHADAGGLSAVVGRALALAADSEMDTEDEPLSEGRAWSAPALEVRELLRGRRMVVIGGERNAHAVDRFIQAFDLADAEWVALTEHGSSIAMRAPINRSDTAVVVVIIKLAGHQHAYEARDYATSAGKPCILLSGGYNPERVAKAILEQASARLKR